MANANTNLMSMLSGSTVKKNTQTQTYSRTNRTNYESKNSKSNLYQTSSHDKKNNFGAELDKANAKIDNTQPTEDAKVVAENVESEAVNTLDTKPTQGKTDKPQDAPTENLSEENPQPTNKNLVAEIIVDELPAQIQTAAPEDTPKIIPQTLDSEIEPQVEIKTSSEILINPVADENIDTAENPAPIIIDDTTDKNSFADDTTDNSALATSADMAYYFASSMDNLLAVKDTPVATDDKPNINLMSIMPQADDDKAQSMLNYLSGRTWESPKLGNDTVPTQNLNLQSLTPQIDNQSNNQPLPIMPQYQPRPLNFQNVEVQPTLQAQPNLGVEIQPTLQAQLNVGVQPTTSQIQPNLEVQNNLQATTPQVQPNLTPQNNLQPATSQVQPNLELQNNLQPVTSQVQPNLEVQNNLQPTTAQVQPNLELQNNLQPATAQVQSNLEVQNNFQPTTAQVQPNLEVQNNLQPATAQVQPNLEVQNNLQPATTQVQPNLEVQNNLQPATSNLQPTTSQAQSDLTPQNNLQATSYNLQPNLEVQNNFQPVNTQPQQQFGAEINPQINSLQPQPEPRMVNQQTVNNMLGVEMQVDDELPNSTPVMPLNNMTQYFEQDPQSARDFRQNPANVPLENETKTSEQTPTAPAENFAGNLVAVNHTQNNQSAAQVQAPEVAQAPRENFNVPAQIVEQARMIRTATNTEMVINLKPEHLGQLTLRVSVTANGAVNASFYSDNAQVRAIIENSIVQLKQDLNDQGIKVDNVEVYAGLSEDGLLNGQGQQAWQQNQQRNQRAPIDFEAVEDEIDALNPVIENVSADGVDYKV